MDENPNVLLAGMCQLVMFESMRSHEVRKFRREIEVVYVG
jgi:hypothetical protein